MEKNLNAWKTTNELPFEDEMIVVCLKSFGNVGKVEFGMFRNKYSENFVELTDKTSVDWDNVLYWFRIPSLPEGIENRNFNDYHNEYFLRW